MPILTYSTIQYYADDPIQHDETKIRRKVWRLGRKPEDDSLPTIRIN